MRGNVAQILVVKKNTLAVCLVSPRPPPYGGIAHWTAMLIDYASDRSDIEFDVVNTAPGWRSIHSGMFWRTLGGGFQLTRDVARLTHMLINRRYDAVHLTTSGRLSVVRDLAVALLTKLLGVRLVYHIRFGRIPAIAGANSFEWRLIRWVMRCSTSVIAIDRATFDSIDRFARDVKVALVPNCVNAAVLPDIAITPCEVKTVLFVGWVVKSKGINELLAAWEMVKMQGWRLEVLGPFEPEYQSDLLRRFSIDDVEFTGQMSHSQTMDRMKRCGLFVLPSYAEGFPNAVVEAMALGRAIIATDVGAIPEMLDGGAGVIVKSKDHWVLAQAMENLMLDAELRESLGRQAFAKAMQQYTIDVVFQSYLKIWRGVSSEK
jgi:glycosyltransferase involved in cell wall biosynthesis